MQHVHHLPRDPRTGEVQQHVYVQVLFEGPSSKEPRNRDLIRGANEEAEERGRERGDARERLPVHGKQDQQLIWQVNGIPRYAGRGKAPWHRVRVQEP